MFCNSHQQKNFPQLQKTSMDILQTFIDLTNPDQVFQTAIA